MLNILRNWQVSKMAAPSTFPLEVYDGPVSSHFCQYLSLIKKQIYFCTCVSVSIKKIPKSGIPGLLFIPIFSFNRTISSQEGLAQFTFNMLAVHNTVHNTSSSLLIWWMKKRHLILNHTSLIITEVKYISYVNTWFHLQ